MTFADWWNEYVKTHEEDWSKAKMDVAERAWNAALAARPQEQASQPSEARYCEITSTVAYDCETEPCPECPNEKSRQRGHASGEPESHLKRLRSRFGT